MLSDMKKLQQVKDHDTYESKAIQIVNQIWLLYL